MAAVAELQSKADVLLMHGLALPSSVRTQQHAQWPAACMPWATRLMHRAAELRPLALPPLLLPETQELLPSLPALDTTGCHNEQSEQATGPGAEAELLGGQRGREGQRCPAESGHAAGRKAGEHP